jgi:hypothetical protein
LFPHTPSWPMRAATGPFRPRPISGIYPSGREKIDHNQSYGYCRLFNSIFWHISTEIRLTSANVNRIYIIIRFIGLSNFWEYPIIPHARRVAYNIRPKYLPKFNFWPFCCKFTPPYFPQLARLIELFPNSPLFHGRSEYPAKIVRIIYLMERGGDLACFSSLFGHPYSSLDGCRRWIWKKSQKNRHPLPGTPKANDAAK